MDTLPPPLERERVSLREEGGKTSSAPTPGLYLSHAPAWRRDCWCWGGGGLSRKQKRQASPRPPQKSIKSPRGPGPSHPSPRTKKCKTLSQNGGLRGAPSLGSLGPCPSPALPRTPRPARSGPWPRGPRGWPEAGPGSGRAMSCRCPMGANPPRSYPQLRASTAH